MYMVHFKIKTSILAVILDRINQDIFLVIEKGFKIIYHNMGVLKIFHYKFMIKHLKTCRNRIIRQNFEHVTNPDIS